MSKEYTSKLSEEDINEITRVLDMVAIANADNNLFYMSNKLKQAKVKPYTNFDKLLEDTRIEEVANYFLNNKFYERLWCEHSKDKRECVRHEHKCFGCVYNWLKREVKR